MTGRGVRITGSSFRSMIGKMYLRMFLPSFISALALSFANIADALVVGNRIGETGLAVIGLATPVYLIYSFLGTGFAGGGAITHARLTAAEKRSLALCHCRRLAGQLLLAGAVIALLGNLFLDTLLTWLGAGPDNPEIRQLCAEYIRPLLTAAPLFFFNFLLFYFVRSDDNPGLASLGFTIGSVLDLLLNILFVIVLRLGVRGAVSATVIAQAVAALVLSFHLFSGRNGILRLKAILSAGEDRGKIMSACRSSYQIGFSSSVSYLFQFLFMLVGNRLLISAGTQGRIDGALAVAVFDLVMNCSYVTVSVYQAASEAMSPLSATFSVVHDEQSLRFILLLAILAGLLPGLVLCLAIGFLAGPVAALFGLSGEDARAMAVYALRVFLLSSPLSGILQVLVCYNQSTKRVRFAAFATLLRNAVILLPVTLLLGIFRPDEFWWLFPLTEGLSLAIVLALARWRQKTMRGNPVPVLTRTITNDNRELGTLLEAARDFCSENLVPPGTAALLQLAVEELCAVTMAQAFSGKSGEYIRITLVAEPGPRYLLYIINSAPYFNPLDMKMAKAQQDMAADLLDSIGVLMIRKKAKSFNYRNYQGYNVMTVEF